ncbi:MAG: hypothetical protein R3B09_06890 [Nannocystaceae bacterium]
MPSLNPRALLLTCALLPACAGDGDTGSDTDADSDSTTGASASSTATSTATSTASSTDASATGESTSTSVGSTSDGSTSDAATTAASTTDATTTTTTTTTDGTSTTGVTADGCSAEALELVDLVNQYRGENGLPSIPASPSLCTVGQTHVHDLVDHSPHTEPGCNLHSWSDAGPWTPCCYTADHAQAMCMWMKPQELTVYPGFGYENAAGGGGTITPGQALDLWKGSSAHNEVILSQGIWADHPWKAVGAGLYQGYAVLWFGEQDDPAG